MVLLWVEYGFADFNMVVYGSSMVLFGFSLVLVWL